MVHGGRVYNGTIVCVNSVNATLQIVVIMKLTYCCGTTQMLFVVHESRLRLYGLRGIMHECGVL